MNQFELILLSIGLAMDACAVAVTDGMSNLHLSLRKSIWIALFFGWMQALMPLLGFFSGGFFSLYIAAFDHYIALILLAGIGGKQILESCGKQKEAAADRLTLPLILTQGVATSIDAFAVGISFAAFPEFQIVNAVCLIGCMTAVICICGFALGKHCGQRIGTTAEILGGAILIGIGLKIFISHMWG